MAKTVNQMESELSDAFVRFQRELTGRGPQEARTHILKDMVIIRLKGVLTTEEKHLAKTDKGRRLIKELRQELREMSSEKIEQLVMDITGCTVLSSHSDISTKSGERIEMFILDRDLEKVIQSQAGGQKQSGDRQQG